MKNKKYLILSFTLIYFLFFGKNCLVAQTDNSYGLDTINYNLNKAQKLWEDKAYEKSILHYQLTFQELKTDDKVEAAIEVGIELSKKLKKIKAYPKAISVLLDCEKIANQLHQNDSLKALMYHNIGLVYSVQDSSIMAVNYYKKAILIREDLYSNGNVDIIRGYNNIGTRFIKLEQLDSALHYLKIAYNRQITKPTKLITTTYSRLGRLYKDIGNIKQAENYYKLNIKEHLKRHKNEPWKILELYHNLSQLYYEFQEPENVIRYANYGIDIGGTFEEKELSDFEYLVQCYNKIGLANVAKKNYEEALIYYSKAENLSSQKLKKSNRKLIGQINENIGITLKRLQKFQQSEERFFRSLNIYQQLNLDIEISGTYNNIGDLYYDQKQYSKALKNYHQSLPYLLPNFNETNEYINPILKDHIISDNKGLLTFLEAKAKTFKTLYDQNTSEKDLIAAHQTYQLLDELIDDIRLSYLEDASKSYLVKQAKPIYEKAIGVCLQYHQFSGDKKYLTEAFKYAEKSKAIILLEQIKEAKANTFAGIPDSLQQKERQLKREIGQLEKQLALQKEEVTTDSLGKSVRAKLIYAKTKYEDLIKRLEEENSEYHQLKYDLQTADITAVQTQMLKDSQLLVEYFVGEDSIYIFKISPTNFEVITKAKYFPLTEWVDALRQGIYYCRVNKEATAEDCAKLDKKYSEYGAKLYQQLVQPLALTDATKEVIIIPDGVLGYIPFDALLTKEIAKDQQNQFHTYPYWGLDYTICYGFSATFLRELQQTNTIAKKNQLLAFAPSFQVPKKEVESLDAIPVDPIYAQRSSLSPLFFNKAEVGQITDEFGGVAYKDISANKTKFIQEVSNYRYLHIASHGKMNEENADLSYIAFTQNGDSTNQEELLYLRELYDLEIPAEMVVLSACETGIGELQNGEGIISLARGFSYAGAKSIITSLWNVNDQKTADLMVDFYKNLSKGQPKDAALANAKRAYIRKNTATFSHPFYWAGFVPIGNMKAIETASDRTWLIGLGLGSLLIGLGFGRYWKSKRQLSPRAA